MKWAVLSLLGSLVAAAAAVHWTSAQATTTVVTPGNSAGMLYLGRETNQTARAPRCTSRKRLIALLPGANCLDEDGTLLKVVSVIRVNGSATTPPDFKALVTNASDSVNPSGDGRFVFPTTAAGGLLGVGANTNSNGGCGGTTTSPDNLFGCPTTPNTTITANCPAGNGWRWPYGGELALLFAGRDAIGGFGGIRYWSAHYTEPNNNSNVSAWLMPFRTPSDVNVTLNLGGSNVEIKGRFRSVEIVPNANPPQLASVRCVKLVTMN
jgi:hypothetical protein